ncbi:hypothetical protein XENORESO_018394 [Xenotaenia resolanae]|uniref:Uncharacterized protein n=1 Tax=Xenotaenia resolanae TaxID=208358 RepID=A0ABV0VRD1_9TELE
MTSVLAEVVVKDLSRDVQLIKNKLAEGNMAPGGTWGPATATPMLPFQLPVASEQDFNEARSLLMEESVRQKMTACLVLVGGTNSDNLMRQMLATAMTSALVGSTGLERKTSVVQKARSHSSSQHCMFAAAP